MKKENGITLIALIVTIIIMLILAGISVRLALDNNGVIDNAREAKDQYEQSMYDDEEGMYYLSEGLRRGLESRNDRYEPEKVYEKATIPEGYYYVGGTEAKGLVISDNVADKEKYKNQEDVGKDLEGNQWVWVPVQDISLCITVEDDKAIELTGGTGVKTTRYSRKVLGEWRGNPGSTDFREPDLITGENGEKYDYLSINCGHAGFSNSKNMAETLVNEYDEMIRSVEKYKGFYIGRYELSEEGEKAASVLTYKSWYELYKSCTTLANGENVKSRMIWGAQWDATCAWLIDSGFSVTDSSSWGNYSDNTAKDHGYKHSTGYSEVWKANNIYDFAGNYLECTQEAFSTIFRVCRGGEAYQSGAEYPALNSKNGEYPHNTNDEATRPMLYIIP